MRCRNQKEKERNQNNRGRRETKGKALNKHIKTKQTKTRYKNYEKQHEREKRDPGGKEKKLIVMRGFDQNQHTAPIYCRFSHRALCFHAPQENMRRKRVALTTLTGPLAIFPSGPGVEPFCERTGVTA